MLLENNMDSQCKLKVKYLLYKEKGLIQQFIFYCNNKVWTEEDKDLYVQLAEFFEIEPNIIEFTKYKPSIKEEKMVVKTLL